MKRRPRLAAATVVGLSGLLAACGSSSSPAAGAKATPAPVSGRVTVFAAASLTAAFNDIGSAFHTKYPNANAVFSFAGSPTLAAQITQGAPADVFASADQPNIQKVVTSGDNDGQPKDFATNKLAIVVQAGNPRGITGLSDLAKPGLVVVLCAPGVPCGTYAQQSLTKAGVQVNPKSQEQDVKGVVTKVSLKEADAGIVYTTDVKAGGASVQGVDVPDAQNVVARYPIVAVKNSTNSGAAQAFIDFVLSSDRQAILARYGFSSP